MATAVVAMPPTLPKEDVMDQDLPEELPQSMDDDQTAEAEGPPVPIEEYEKVMGEVLTIFKSCRLPVRTPLPNMWAFLVGIQDYPQPDLSQTTTLPEDAGTTLDHWAPRAPDDEPVGDPLGAIDDVSNVYKYLVHERNVPADHVIVLRNEEATRDEIIHKFRSHLTNNDAIGWDDPILFYYSGHGCRGPAPDGWVAALDVPSEDSHIEYIVPYDSVIYGQGGGKPGIPDRTTRALIYELSVRHGRNINVVLDCCHSGHGTRKPTDPSGDQWRARGIKSHHVGQLRPDTDAEIWASAEKRNFQGRRSSASVSFTERKHEDDTNVLLAACDRLQPAFGTAGFGGIFTNAWLATLREGRARTYAEALGEIKAKLAEVYNITEAFYKRYPDIPPAARLEKQNPQCEGFNRDRLLFQSASQHAQWFDVTPGEDATDCIIHGAGINCGIKQGTMFELCRSADGAQSEPKILGSVIAQNVETERCIAKLPEGLFLHPGDPVKAIVSKLCDPVTFNIRNRKPESAEATKAFEDLNVRLSGESPYYERASAKDADIIFEVDDEHVHFERQDIRLAGLDTTSPSMPIDQIASRFPSIMKNIAHFNYYLSFESNNHPFATQVELRLHELVRANVTYKTDTFTFIDTYRNMMAGEPPVQWENGEATILHENDEQLYALVLKNSSLQDLFAYILLFDPSTYEVNIFAQPLNSEDPALKRGLEIQFGRSAECQDALWFDVGDDQKKDTGYLKVILSTEGSLHLGFMEQPPVLGDDAELNGVYGQRNSAAGAPQPLKGVWDVITRKLTVLPKNVP